MAEPENRDSGKRGPRNDRRDDRRGPAPERRDAGQSSRPPRREDARDEEKLEGKDFIYGARTVMEAMEAGRAIDKILMKKGLDSELRNDVYDLAQKANIPIQVVPVEKLDRLARNMNHQGVVAFTVLVPYADLEQVLIGLEAKGKEPLLLMIDQVSDVRNFGGITRSAECLGVDAIVIPEQGSARISADAMKASAGALNHVPVCRVHHLQDAVYMLKDRGVRIVTCGEKAKATLWETDLKGPLCLVFGSEDKGITPRIIKSSDAQLSIPMLGQISSLNVGVSVGVVLAEVVRQRVM
ncbi:MAG: tRNA/rRNA methyltransferase, TrmH family [Bacteroidota bacterium]|jgi:23S rRNA (guanosine2251-2'-O)-methyltransferase